MAKKIVHGNNTYDLLIDLIFSLSPLQVKALYTELLARYTKRSRVKLYDAEGNENPEGKIRLMPLQYKAIRTKFGDNFMKKSFSELTNYIEYLEKNMDTVPNAKGKLQKLRSITHNALLAHEDGWVYNKCKGYIVHDRPKLNINPFLIDDVNTAREYIRHIPLEVRESSMDVKMLLLKFPEVADETYEV